MGVHAGLRGGRGRLAGLLASSSVAALLMGSGGPAAVACYAGASGAQIYAGTGTLKYAW